uniref:non-specific serine/threonine protein kinase n=1 Tax=Petromyzon marinus TaxID=7757 RepID=A0A6M4RTI5_PETMA|nr:receptor-interacting serine/threonine-protein kinase 7 [Petromyzon marinus]
MGGDAAKRLHRLRSGLRAARFHGSGRDAGVALHGLGDHLRTLAADRTVPEEELAQFVETKEHRRVSVPPGGFGDILVLNGAHGAILQALRSCPESGAIQASGLACLARLADALVKLSVRDGEAERGRDDAEEESVRWSVLVDGAACWHWLEEAHAALEMHGGDAGVKCALLEKQTLTALLQAMEEHGSCARMQRGACLLLSLLLAGRAVPLDVMTVAVSAMALAMRRHAGEGEEEPLSGEMHLAIFISELAVQEAGLRVLECLAAGEGAPDLLLQQGATDSTLHSMQTYPRERDVQLAGLNILGFLTPLRVWGSTTLSVLAEVITGCSLALALLKSSPQAPKIFLKCMVCMTRRQGVRDSMLRAASEAGDAELAEFLLLMDADPNESTGHDSLLCKQDVALTELLLKHGACEADVHAALRQSLARGNADIVGLLLHRLGSDPANKAVSLGRLRLASLHAAWLRPLFTQSKRHAGRTGLGVGSRVAGFVLHWLEEAGSPAVGGSVPASLWEMDLGGSALWDGALMGNSFGKDDTDGTKLAFKLWGDVSGVACDASVESPSPPASQKTQEGVHDVVHSVDLSGNELSGDISGVLLTQWLMPHLSKLLRLDLQQNRLTAISPALATALKSLTSLNLSDNGFQEFPLAVLLIESLVYLGLSHNFLASPLRFDSPVRCSHLRTLNLSHNGMAAFPEGLPSSFGNLDELLLEGLRVVDLGSNCITVVPRPSLWRTGMLKELLLGNNLVEAVELTGASGTWARLEKLHLGHNRMTEVPKGIGQLESLTSLDLSYNDITTLPNELGGAGRGKSTLLRRLQREKLLVSTATLGVDVRDWAVLHRQRKFVLNCWDFAGQEEFYSTHPCFMSQRALYVLVYDASRGPDEVASLRPWLMNIKVRAPLCPVILVGTHEDKIAAEEKETLMGSSVRCIEELCTEIQLTNIVDHKIKGQPVMGQLIPHSYGQLEERLCVERGRLAAGFPVISRSRLQDLVADSQIPLDSEELPHATRFLHEAGVLLHYDDPALQLTDLYFLDPQWLCSLMAQVVTVREVNPFGSTGLLRRADVEGFLLRRSGFPQEYVGHYIRLLERFQIALPLGDHGDTLLVPSRAAISTTHGSFLQPSRKYWRQGLSLHWGPDAYCLLEAANLKYCPTDSSLKITVPNSKRGWVLLGRAVDHVDSLIEEWFPGLLEPHDGSESSAALLHQWAGLGPADDAQPPCVRLAALQDIAESDDVVFFPRVGERHLSGQEEEREQESRIPIAQLAPDVVLADVPDHLQLDLSSFSLEQSAEHLLGELPPARTPAIASELAVLSRSRHPSLVSLLAVGLRPRVLVMELAPRGSLAGVMEREGELHRTLKHRIALHVAHGLRFLHASMIIYRDLKPDNVLLFTLQPNAAVIAKIADYGIARHCCTMGMVSPDGTPGYRAPEVVKGGVMYDQQADVYAFGLLLYDLLTGGRRIVEGLRYPHEFDELASSGKLPGP